MSDHSSNFAKVNMYWPRTQYILGNIFNMPAHCLFLCYHHNLQLTSTPSHVSPYKSFFLFSMLLLMKILLVNLATLHAMYVYLLHSCPCVEHILTTCMVHIQATPRIQHLLMPSPLFDPTLYLTHTPCSLHIHYQFHHRTH